jgi:hypothetical protein
VQHTFLFHTTLIPQSIINYGSYALQTTRNCWDNGEYTATSMINFTTLDLLAPAMADGTMPINHDGHTNHPIGS